LLRNVLPREWVLRGYKPDYGIDLAVEVFKYVDEKRAVAESLGEIFLRPA